MKSDEISFTDDHILLWEHNLPSYQLFYNSVADNCHEILGLLWEAHEIALQDFIEHQASISPQNFAKQYQDGFGLLARGPKLLLEAYQGAVSGKLDTYMVESYKPKGGYSALLFDYGHVLSLIHI